MRCLSLRTATLLAAVICPLSLAQPPAQKPAETQAAQPVTADPNLPTGESLFAKHVAAIGGLDAIKAQKTILTKASFTRGGSSSGLITIYRQAPDKMYKILEIPGSVTIETWYDGERAWARNSNVGAGKLSGANLASVKQEASIVGESDYKTSFKSLATTEKTTFADRPAYAVAAVASDDAKRTLYFDTETGFLIGAKVPTTDPEKPLVLKFSDYKEYGKVKHPSTIVEEVGKDKTTITYKQIDVDVTFRTSLEPPDEVKNLK